MVQPHDPEQGSPDRLDWQPATSAPGELFTPDGQIRAWGAVARNLRNSDPRARRHRRSMVRTGLSIVAVGVAVLVLIVALSSIF